MSYVDCFLIAVPKKNMKAYVKSAKGGARVWKKHGALEYVETVADDLETGMGTSFKKLMKLKPTETAVFSYIVYKSRAHRDAVNKKVMSDPSMNNGMEMPFDMRRLSFGGFKPVVSR